MILSKTPVTMAEANEIIKKLEDKQPLQDYMKNFTKLTKDKAEKLRKEITDLNNMKIKEEQIIKIVDFLPTEKEELNKIVMDVTLSEEESNAILEITKRY